MKIADVDDEGRLGQGWRRVEQECPDEDAPRIDGKRRDASRSLNSLIIKVIVVVGGDNSRY